MSRAIALVFGLAVIGLQDDFRAERLGVSVAGPEKGGLYTVDGVPYYVADPQGHRAETLLKRHFQDAKVIKSYIDIQKKGQRMIQGFQAAAPEAEAQGKAILLGEAGEKPLAWMWTGIGNAKQPGPGTYRRMAVADGKYQNWIVGAAKEAVEIKDDWGEPIRVYRIVLSREPETPLMFGIFPVSW